MTTGPRIRLRVARQENRPGVPCVICKQVSSRNEWTAHTIFLVTSLLFLSSEIVHSFIIASLLYPGVVSSPIRIPHRTNSKKMSRHYSRTGNRHSRASLGHLPV